MPYHLFDRKGTLWTLEKVSLEMKSKLVVIRTCHPLRRGGRREEGGV